MSDPPRSADELDAWIEATVSRALAYALTLVRNRAEAEDIVHDCYGRLLARGSAYDLTRDGEKLLFKAIANACINWTQRRPPTASLEAVARSPEANAIWMTDRTQAGPEQHAMGRELEEAIEDALGELTVTQRAVVQLRSLGYSLVEVAEMLEISHANARTLLHRGREKLAIRLRPYLEENLK